MSGPRCSRCSVNCFSRHMPEGIFEEYVDFVDYESGDNVIQQGAPIQNYHILCEGYVKIGSRISSGKQAIFSLIHRPDIIEKPCIHNDQDYYPLYAVTVTPARIGLITVPRFEELLERYPKFTQCVSEMISQELEFQLRKIAVKNCSGSRETLIWLLSHYDSQLNGDSDNGDVRDLHLSELDLAHMVGVSRETVVRHLSSMREKGLAKATRNSVVVLDHDRLTKAQSRLSIF